MILEVAASGGGLRADRCLEHAARVLLLLLVASLPLQAVLVLPTYGTTLTKLLGGTLILVEFVRRKACGQRLLPSTGIGDAIAFFALACLFSVTDAVHPLLALGALATLTSYVVVFYAVASVAALPGIQDRIVVVFVMSVCLAAVASLLAWAGYVTPTVDGIEPGSGVHRICFGLNDPNEQAMAQLFGLCFLLFWPFEGARGSLGNLLPRRWWRAFGVVFVLAGLVSTMSRTGWCVAGLLLLVRYLFAQRRPAYAVVFSAASVTVAVAIAACCVDFGDEVGRRIASAASVSDPSIASRLAHYSEAGPKALEHGVTGHGLGATLRLEIPFRDPLGNPLDCTVHSVPLIVWLDSGGAGLIAYGWLWAAVVALVYTVWRGASEALLRRQITSYAAVVAVYACFSLVMPFLYRPSLAVLLGCLVGAFAKARGVCPEL